jgi:myosin heavy subunit
MQTGIPFHPSICFKKTNQIKKKESMYARDALSKALYGALFNWIVEKINETLEKPSKEEDELDQDEEEEKKKKGHNIEGYIGVLDIFGFESFEVNGLEQLLINFANEALQDTFNKKVSNMHSYI